MVTPIMSHTSLFQHLSCLHLKFLVKTKVTVLCSWQEENFSWSHRSGEIHFIIEVICLGYFNSQPSFQKWTRLIAFNHSSCLAVSEGGLIHFNTSCKMDTTGEQMCTLLCNYFQLSLCPLLSVWNLTLMESEWHLPRDQLQIVGNSQNKGYNIVSLLIAVCDRIAQ